MSGDGQPWRAAAVIVSQTAVLTAVLFYFGWARTSATFEYFGVDVSLLGFSTSDYVLRSVNSAFRPLLLVGLIAVVAIGVHQWLLAAKGRGGSGSPRLVRHVPVVALSVGVALAAPALAGIAVPDLGRELGIWLPICLGAGFALLAYAEHGWPRFRDSQARATPDPLRQLRSFLLAGLALMALFWTVSLYAVQTGREKAQALTRDLAFATEVDVYAEDRLALRGPGVRVEYAGGADSKYKYRYRGLRLLVRSQDRYVLLPVGWSRGDGRAYVLRDRDDIRLEFTVRTALPSGEAERGPRS
jgi:hypothetical protein